MNIIGREREIIKLNKLMKNKDPILLAVYGRRRVGKTFLINNYFNNKFLFKHTGVSSVEFSDKTHDEILAIELNYFKESLNKCGLDIKDEITSWQSAFSYLETLIKKSDSEKKVIFIDEMPWLDTKDSMFITAFEFFWNNFGSTCENLLFIVCGSASSWINDKLINEKGGLYNRVTYEIKLKPFTLNEVEQLIKKNNFDWMRYQIAKAYMILGGIPYYLNYLDSEYTLEQNIDNLFFNKNAKFKDEFNRLFDSTFDNPNAIKAIIRILSKNQNGLTREQIAKETHISLGGNISKFLNALLESDFIIKYKSFKTKEREWTYKLIDPFSLFYLRFVENKESINEYFYSQNFNTPSLISWSGNAFEILCFNHVESIKKALGISGVITNAALYQTKGDNEKKGSQIDLILERKDHIINLIEAKFCGDSFILNKDDYFNILNKDSSLQLLVGKRTIIQNVLITTFSLRKNMYSDIFKMVITLDDLFIK